MKWSERLDKELFEIAVNIGPWFVPVAAALVFGVSFATAVTKTLGPVAGVAGFFAAIGLEIAGIISFHVSIAYYSLRQYDKFFMALSAGLAYIAIGIGGVWAIDSNIAFRTVGTITFLLIPIVYLSRALAHDLTRTTDQVIERQGKTENVQAETRAHKREMERLRIELGHNERLAQIEINNPLSAERPRTSEQYAEQLRTIRERSNGSPVKVQDVQAWANVGRTTAYEILKLPDFEQIGRGQYVLNGGQNGTGKS